MPVAALLAFSLLATLLTVVLLVPTTLADPTVHVGGAESEGDAGDTFALRFTVTADAGANYTLRLTPLEGFNFTAYGQSAQIPADGVHTFIFQGEILDDLDDGDYNFAWQASQGDTPFASGNAHLEVTSPGIDAILILLIFIVAFAVILTDMFHRTIVAWVGAMGVFAVGKAYGTIDEHMLFGFVDFNVIGLLMGMMIIAAMLEISGFFEFIAIKATKLSKGEPWRLILYLGGFTTVISMFIDNVTAVILIAPVAIRICGKLKINPIPLLVSLAMMSNTGGVGTLVGDPPNVMIASASGFGFNSFIIRLFPMVLVAWFVTATILYYHFREWRSERSHHVEDLMNVDEWDMVKDRKLMYRTLGVLTLTVLGFSCSELLHLGIDISAIALLGAGMALAVNQPDIHAVLVKVEWAALLFFACLFIMVGGLDEMGHLEALARWIFDVTGGDGMMLVIAIIWISAIASAIVDNIPFTAAMILVIQNLSEQGLIENTAPLYWALAMGAGFGGNGTPIGSSAGVIVVSMAERAGHPITPREWMKVGLPMLVATCIVATIFIVIFYDILYTTG